MKPILLSDLQAAIKSLIGRELRSGEYLTISIDSHYSSITSTRYGMASTSRLNPPEGEVFYPVVNDADKTEKGGAKDGRS